MAPKLPYRESPPFRAGEEVNLINYYGSKMLHQQGLSIDDVVGYRILDLDEEPEFRKQRENKYATVVRYYTKK